RRQDARHQVGPDGAGHAEPVRAARAMGQRVRTLEKTVELLQHAPRVADELPSDRALDRAAPAPLEQTHAERLLEACDLRRQSRLTDAELLRGTPEALRVRHGDEVLELTQ